MTAPDFLLIIVGLLAVTVVGSSIVAYREIKRHNTYLKEIVHRERT